MTDLLFWPFAALLIVSALGVVLCRNLYRAAYCLAAALIVTALFYFVMGKTAKPDDNRRFTKPVWAAILSLAVFIVLASYAGDLAGAPQTGGLESGKEIGITLFRTYLVPFELLSVLLLAAIFGALVIARKEEGS